MKPDQTLTEASGFPSCCRFFVSVNKLRANQSLSRFGKKTNRMSLKKIGSVKQRQDFLKMFQKDAFRCQIRYKKNSGVHIFSVFSFFHKVKFRPPVSSKIFFYLLLDFQICWRLNFKLSSTVSKIFKGFFDTSCRRVSLRFLKIRRIRRLLLASLSTLAGHYSLLCFYRTQLLSHNILSMWTF